MTKLRFLTIVPAACESRPLGKLFAGDVSFKGGGEGTPGVNQRSHVLPGRVIQ
jgi:hypothetical protein